MDDTARGRDSPAVTESVWRPRSSVRLVAGLVAAAGLPIGAATALVTGYVRTFPSLGYIACIVLAAMIGRLIAAVLAVAVSAALVSYFLIKPQGFTAINSANVVDFAIFILVGMLIAVVLAGSQRSRAAAGRSWLAAQLAQQRLAIISDASRTLASSFDLANTVEQVCQQVVRGGGWDHMLVLTHEAAGLRYLARAHATKSARAGNSHRAGDVGQDAIPEAVTATVHARQIQLLGRHRRVSRFGRWRYRSGLAVPLLGTDGPAGALVLLHKGKARSYSANDLTFAAELGNRICMAMDNASRYQQQVHIAHTLQQSLLPRGLPEIPGVTVYATYTAGTGTEVGGDFYDVFPVGDGRWMAVVGDVAGKGPEAATVMSIARATLRALALHEQSPQRLLSLLNEALLAQVPDRRFVTVCCALVEPTPTGAATIVMTRAGHPAPVLRRKGRPAGLAEGPSGVLLGAFTTVALSETTLHLEAGDTITFYTDGIESREHTAEERALRLLSGHDGGPPETIAARFADARPYTTAGKADDLVVLTLAVGTIR